MWEICCSGSILVMEIY